MSTSLSRFAFAFILSCSTLATAQTAPPKYKTNLPPSADLAYAIKARQSGLTINGDARIQWQNDGGKYRVATEARAMLAGKILDERSEGAIDAHGLAPAAFTQKRYRKEATTTTFDRQARVIRFAGSDKSYPIKGGEQDRGSAMWQLIAVARAAPAKFRQGSSWTFFVAGQRDAEPWTFKVGKQEKIKTPQGEMTALHVVKTPPPDSKEQQIDLWLAPALEWYPVRMRYTDGDGEYIEQTLESLTRK
jgi:hypothetical protein